MMSKEIAIFSITLVVAALIQVSFLFLPFGLILLLLWYLWKDTEGLPLLIILFGVSFAVAGNFPVWLILLSTALAIYVFIYVKAVLPEKQAITASLFVLSLLSWELTSQIMLRLLSL